MRDAPLVAGRVHGGVHLLRLVVRVGPVGVVVPQAAQVELARLGGEGAPWALGRVLPRMKFAITGGLLWPSGLVRQL